MCAPSRSDVSNPYMIDASMLDSFKKQVGAVTKLVFAVGCARLKGARLNGRQTYLVHDFAGFATTARFASLVKFFGNPCGRVVASGVSIEQLSSVAT